MYESGGETDKNEGLADDCRTTITMMDLDSLTEVKRVLDLFDRMSGLICNFDKSSIMPILLQTQEKIASVTDLGFTITDNFKLLGLDLCYDLGNIG